MQGGIERAFFDVQQFIGSALNVQHDAIPVQRPRVGESLEDEQIEISLEIVFRRVSLAHEHP